MDDSVIRYLSTTEKTSRRSFLAHYEQLLEFERGYAIKLKETGWANQRIARHMAQSDAAIKRCWKEWVGRGRLKQHDDSGRSRVTADREDRLISRSAVTAPDS
ncbi:uncharacterized protein TNCV_1054741 [Trichonephila clavipes]|nr:uncharacterized protein TNCV_1054741 [Trichonephila clavipes]